MDPVARQEKAISTHTPLARRDEAVNEGIRQRIQFLLTRLLRGATPLRLPRFQILHHFYSHASCEARLGSFAADRRHLQFLLTRLLRGATIIYNIFPLTLHISTHTPLARRDIIFQHKKKLSGISTHTPLARRDLKPAHYTHYPSISTHTPLARRDPMYHIVSTA